MASIDQYGIKISQPGTNVYGAPDSQLVMNTANPFLKLDTQNPNSFQSILLLINTDPPDNAYTVLYKFAHGYKYVPSVETLFYVETPPPSTSFYQEYFLDSGVIGSHSAYDYALLYTIADETYVYYVCEKYYDSSFGIGGNDLLTGTNIQITTHVFVHDIGI